MPLTIQPEAERTDPRGDDYLVEGEGPSETPPLALRVVRLLQGVVVVVLALLSLAVFWTVGVVLGVL